jgi:hypothetical protein
MKTRKRERGVPEPGSPWNEITSGLWMGGHHWIDTAGEERLVVVGREFDVVLSLVVRSGHGPAPGVEHHVAEVPDAPLTALQLGQVRQLAVIAAESVRNGRKTLVRCQSGFNRSGLVVVQALVDLGHDTGSAIDLVRRKRSRRALNNEVFEQYLETGLEVAQLLVGLSD